MGSFMVKKYTEIECLCQLNSEDGIGNIVALKKPCYTV